MFSVKSRFYHKGKFHFWVRVDDTEYWGNYSFDEYDFRLCCHVDGSNYNEVLGNTFDDKVIGNWTYEEVRKLVWLGKVG